MSSLGGLKNAYPRMAAPANLAVPQTEIDVPSYSCKVGTPKGLLPVLIYSTAAFFVPFIYLYFDLDFTSTVTRALVITVASASALVTLYSNSSTAWYNMLLFFYIGLEVKVIDVALTYAYAEGTPNVEMGLSITAAVVVIVHLIPFVLYDGVMLLTLLAFAGIIVNNITLLYLSPDLLLLVGVMSVTLLSTVMMVCPSCKEGPSILTLTREAMKSGMAIRCDEMSL